MSVTRLSTLPVELSPQSTHRVLLTHGKVCAVSSLPIDVEVNVTASDVTNNSSVEGGNLKEVVEGLNVGKAAASHGHAIADVTGLQTALDGKAPSSHSHAIADVTGLQTALDGKAPSSHSHAIADVTNLQTTLNGKAAASHSHTAVDLPALNALTAPSAALDMNSQKITGLAAPTANTDAANKSYVDTAVAGGGGGGVTADSVHTAIRGMSLTQKRASGMAVSVTDTAYNADVTGATDAKSAFDSALSASDVVIVPGPATYLLSSAVTLGSGKRLILMPGVVISGTLTESGGLVLALNAFRQSTGVGNVGLGLKAGDANTTGVYNTAVGANALTNRTTGDRNTALGADTLRSNGGSNNTAVGYGAGWFNTGSANTFLGFAAGQNTTSGSNNTDLGYYAGYSITTGSYNINLGYKSGDNITTGNYNIVIGYDIDAPSATTHQQLVIGNLIYGISVDGSGTTVSTGKVGIKKATPAYDFDVAGNINYSGSLTNVSDAALKREVSSIRDSLGLLKKLRPVLFRWLDAGSRLHRGFIAQEVREVIPDIVPEVDGVCSVSYLELIPLIVDSLQSIDRRLAAIEGVA